MVKFNIPLFDRYFYNHLSNYTETIRLRLGEFTNIHEPEANNCYLSLTYCQFVGKFGSARNSQP